MRLFSIFIAITLNAAAMTHFAAAQELMPIATTQTELPTCHADAKKALRGMCMYVGSQDSDSSAQKPYKYLYQRKLFEASCVDLNSDSEELIAKKVSKTWSSNEEILKCSNTQFDVHNGSLLKYAVNSNFDDFIADVIRWKVNLNKIDEVDGRTILDYTADLIVKNKGNGLEPILKRYYENLRKGGAKHASEL